MASDIKRSSGLLGDAAMRRDADMRENRGVDFMWRK